MSEIGNPSSPKHRPPNSALTQHRTLGLISVTPRKSRAPEACGASCLVANATITKPRLAENSEGSVAGGPAAGHDQERIRPESETIVFRG